MTRRRLLVFELLASLHVLGGGVWLIWPDNNGGTVGFICRESMTRKGSAAGSAGCEPNLKRRCQ